MQGDSLFFTQVLHNSAGTPFSDLIGVFILESYVFCFFLHKVKTSSGAQPAPYSTGTEVLSLG